jgi:sterol desaturase/sphingolipid hydroxylase (fatty acid hydroxylase superfamily)
MHEKKLVHHITGMTEASHVISSDAARSASATTPRIHPIAFLEQVFIARIVAGASVTVFLRYYLTIEDALQDLYPSIRDSAVFQHESFEPLLASTVFFILILGWYLIDRYVPVLHRYRIQSSDSLVAWKNRQEVFFKEAAWYLLPLLVFDHFVKRRRIPIEPPSLSQLIREVMVALLIYDSLFFFVHRTWHASRWLFHAIHSRHHESFTVRAGDSIRHHWIDGTTDVLFSVIALNIQRAHPLSRAVYNIIAITLLVEAHSGMNFPWMLHNLLPHIFAGSVLHDIHHRYGKANFQKFFIYLDYVFGSYDLTGSIEKTA